ncbi:MAG: hypothetical protein Q4C01_07200 [Clostridia bacterium]|nr:hypothetical protein [Clostridia bacterium]
MEKKTMLMFIPNTGMNYVEGSLNGHNFRIKTGEAVEVPLELAAIVTESQRAIAIDKKSVDAFVQTGGKRVL